jgi:cytochrome P450
MARFDPLAEEVLPNPYPFYRRLQETDPIHWGAADDAGRDGRWYVVRYDDVMAVLRDPRLGREVEPSAPSAADQQQSQLPGRARLEEVAQGWMILRDPPAHTRLRGLVNWAYTPRRIAQFAPAIEALARTLIDEMRAAGPPRDLLADFALPLTVLMTAHVLGLPVDDRDRLAEWSRSLAAIIDLNQEEAIQRRSLAAVVECTDYLRDIIRQRRTVVADDLVGRLLRPGEDGQAPASDAEAIGTVTHLLFVGNDPVMHLIGNALITLAAHPEQRRWLAAHLEHMEPALDELMRYDSPVQMTFRYALEDVQMGGRQMRAGDHVAVVLGAANRDAGHFSDPDLLNFARPAGLPAHFGMGIHYCLGAPLARLEGRIALRVLLEELPELALAAERLEWQRTVAVRGVTRLPVTF